MNLDRLAIVRAIAAEMSPDAFTTRAWVWAPDATPGPVNTLPDGARTDLVGALPRYEPSWGWFALQDPVAGPSSVTVCPLWCGSALWTPESQFLFGRDDMSRMLLGVWYQVGEWLECDNIGLLEALLGSVAPGARAGDLDSLTDWIDRAMQAGDKLGQCPKHVADALAWLAA